MRKKRFTRRDHVYKKPTINSDSFDKRRFNELLFMSKGLQKVRKEGKSIPNFDQLMGDIWSSFFKNNPQLLNKEEIQADLLSNRQLMKRILNDETFKENHEYTKLDDLHSVLSTIALSDKVFDWIQQQTKNNQNMQQAYQNMNEQLKQHGENSQAYQKAMQNFSEMLNEHIEKKHDSKAFSEMLKKSIEEAKGTEENLIDLVGGIKAGTGSNEELKQMPLRDQFTLAEYLKNHKNMKEIAKWAGRFKAIAKSKQKSLSKESIARSGIHAGSDIDRILPSELINMGNPISKKDFLRRFVEHQTLQYATKGKQTLGQGPIILCLDQSGSMRNLDNQSKGFTLALMSIARLQKRNFALITFDSLAKTKQYPKGEISTKEMVNLCENFMGGGTNFQNPLDESIKLINGSRFKNADIVFVTDGDARVSDQFLKKFNTAKKDLGFSVLSLLIGNSSSKQTVSSFSDKIYNARDFKDKNAHEVLKI